MSRDKCWQDITSELLHDQSFIEKYNGCIYHYTNYEGLLGILQSQKFWATESSYLNDSSEISYGLELCKTFLDERLKKIQYGWENDFINQILHSLSMINHYELYISCFSEEKDLLSQWKGYANNGNGFAIGLKVSELSRFKRKHPMFKIDIAPIIYDYEKQYTIISQKYHLLINELSSYQLENDFYDIKKSFASCYASYLKQKSIFFKSIHFSEEKEWRAVYNNIQVEVERNSSKFRIVNNMVIPYIELDISPSAEKKQWFLPIEEIIVGSIVNFEYIHKSVGLIYKNLSNENVPNLIKSKIPLK